MVTRRKFLSGAVVSSAIVGTPAARAMSIPISSLIPRRAVVDRSLSLGDAFARRAEEHGAAIDWFSGDISTLWLTKLTPMLRAQTAPIAGLTTTGALFCIERWAWDLGMRVVQRIDHVPATTGGWQHASAAPLPEAAIAHLVLSGRDFASHAADIAFAGSSLWSDCTHAAATRSADSLPDPVVSWVIAPTPARV